MRGKGYKPELKKLRVQPQVILVSRSLHVLPYEDGVPGLHPAKTVKILIPFNGASPHETSGHGAWGLGEKTGGGEIKV